MKGVISLEGEGGAVGLFVTFVVRERQRVLERVQCASQYVLHFHVELLK